MSTIAVVGATGRVGRPLTFALRERGHAVRALGRSAEHLQPLVAQGAEPWVGGVEDPKFLAQAFRGADAVFAMLPPDYGHPDPVARSRSISDATAAAVQVARVRHVVSLSSIGADQPDGNGPIAGLHHLERRLDQVPGLSTLHLRAGYFMENFLANLELIRGAGINGNGFPPDLALTMIAARDVALAAAARLGDLGWTGHRVLELQGPRPYTLREATLLLGAAIGRPELPYVEFAPADLKGALQVAGFSEAMADQFLEMVAGFSSGHLAPRQPRSPETTTPTTFEEFARTTFAPAFGA